MRNSSVGFVVTQTANDIPVTILRAKGKLDYSTYLDLIAASQQIYQSGAPNLLVDLQTVPYLGLSGLFALYSTALLFQGETPPDPEGGMPALNYMAEKVRQTQLHHFRLFKPTPQVEKALAPSGLPIYDDLASALASFSR